MHLATGEVCPSTLVWAALILFVQYDEEKLEVKPCVVEASLSALRDSSG